MRTSPFALVLLLMAGACSDSSGPKQAGPPSALAVVSGTPQEGESGEALPIPLTVKATDASGRPVAKAVVTFSVTAGGGTLSASVDTTDASGVASVTWTMGTLLGAARAEARVAGVLVPAVFNATVKAGPPSALQRVSPSVGNSAGGFDVLDSVAVKVVDRFDHPIAGATVSFTVSAGGGSSSHPTKTTGTDGIARTAWQLGGSGPQALRAAVGGIETTVTGTAVTCPETPLAVGQITTITPGAANCLVLTGSAQKLLVSVVNTTSDASSAIGFRLRGAGSTTSSVTTSSTARIRQHQLGVVAAGAAQERTSARAHAELLRANAELLDRLAPARRALPRMPSVVQAAPVPAVGEVLPVRIPTNFSSLCSLSSAKQIGGRVVYVGTRAVILEDTLAPVKGEHDAVYQAIGQEFDNVMWPILTANFGNPLAMDAQLDNNGKLFMVFSPEINALAGGTVLGFVTGGDFFTAAQGCPASNVGEYFYARVPTRAGGGFDSDNTTQTGDEWLRSTRTVIIHEVKHITSFAEKFASPDVLPSNFFPRDAWLEEGTAMIAEELWARTVFGYAFKGNVDYQASVFCEVRPTNASCAGKPRSMFDHFFWLAEFAGSSETRSPIGDVSDGSVYGSSWLFLRWLLDQFATSEAALLKPMTVEALRPGVESIEARFSRPFAELINDWSVAFAVDDYPGITVASQRHRIPSWNVRDIFNGLNVDFSSQGFFLQPFPLKVRPAGFGKFLIDVTTVRGGGMSVAEISGVQGARQLLEFKGLSGTEFPGEMRINIMRVQ